LVEKVTGCDRAGAIQKVAAATGQSPVFRQPDAKAIARYQYHDTSGNLRKEVLRFPGKEFQQRRPVAGGWTYNVAGMKPMLFNCLRAQFADTVVVCEGERDAQNVTELRLQGRNDEVVGVTSGGSDSWDSSLAKFFTPVQRVVVLGDDDEAGRRYVADVTASLEAEGITFITGSFAGTGAKDVSDYLEERSPEELIRHIGSEWLRMPDGRQIVNDDAPCTMDEAGELTI
jgi:5S rRNA maturation endonuclease (ribonuclease M5)